MSHGGEARRRRRGILPLGIVTAILVLAALAFFVLDTRPDATETAPADPPGSFAFAALGDAPYYFWEEWKMRGLVRELNARELAFVIHVGDILWRPCSDEMFRRRRSMLDGIHHPVVFTPGDNDWTDCHGAAVGGYDPLERLDSLRDIFFTDPSRSLGARPMPVARQGNGPSEPAGRFDDFVENATWDHGGAVFVTVHLVGSRNGLEPFDGRTGADDLEVVRRTEAATAWMRRAFSHARAIGAGAVVIAFHAAIPFSRASGTRYRSAYEPFLERLEQETERFEGAVLIVHGDDHEYRVDRPLKRQATGRRLDNLTRAEVPGSPDVGWVRIVVAPSSREPFRFEAHVAPWWRFWR